MMRKLLMILLPLSCVVLLLSCGDDVDVKRAITDQNGVVFLEGGTRDTVNTSFSSAELKAALLANKWEFGYSFFYDDYVIGNRGEDLYVSRFIYEYREDGTATATDLTYGTEYEYSYTVNARVVTLTGSTSTFTFSVIGLDSEHMVCDESLTGQTVYYNDYDSASLTRRMVFYAQ